MSAPVVGLARHRTTTQRMRTAAGCALLGALLLAPGGLFLARAPSHDGRGFPVLPAAAPVPNSRETVAPVTVPATSPPALGNWTQISTNVSPPSEQSGTMIYDPAAGEYVLFGGASGGNALGSTWVFAHGTWKDLFPNLTVSPPARWYNSFVWDASDGYGLLFGGRNPSTDLNDTWTFNGTAWTQVVTSVAPPPITTGRTVYDAADGVVWLYGGYSIMPGVPNAYNFTWTYHGGVWTNITANVTGAPGDPHQVSYAVYDSLDGDVLMYGGSGTGGSNCTQ
ncbi:MAG TPA: hypothetical protein VN842_01855, partial [Thermoplasmata archaeon]|nr:hypothetical protein [Thermoplasmata archaeon]